MANTTVPQNIPTTVVSGATGTGAQTGFWFPPTLGGGNFNVVFHCTGTYSVCTATLEVSSDSSTWVLALAAVDLVLLPCQLMASLVSGLIYRWNIKTFVGTSITIIGTRN